MPRHPGGGRGRRTVSKVSAIGREHAHLRPVVVIDLVDEDLDALGSREAIAARSRSAWRASLQLLQAGLGSEEGQAAVGDIPNFATGGVTIFFAEID